MKTRKIFLSIIAFWVLVFLLPNPLLAKWTIIEVVDKLSCSNTAIALDSNNRPYITCRGRSPLSYYYYDGTQWQYKTVDSAGEEYIKDNSIAIDSQDKMHISYYYDDYYDYVGAGVLKYATNASGSWATYSVDSGDETYVFEIYSDSEYVDGSYLYLRAEKAKGNYYRDVGEDNSIAIDSHNKVHIGYLDKYARLITYPLNEVVVEVTGSFNGLKYATNASGSWATYTVYSYGGVESSIAIDSQDKVHISYCVYYEGLKYVTNASGSWTTYTVDSSSGVGENNSIAIDSQDKVHISYDSYNNDDLEYATNASGSWTTYTLDSGIGVGQPSIAIDSQDKVHISYLGHNGLKYATNASLKTLQK